MTTRRSPLRFRLLRWTAGCLLGVLSLSAALVLPWRWIAPPTTMFIVRERLASEGPVQYRWVSWSDMAPSLAIAAIAAEDQKFPLHHGFDFDQIADAVRERQTGRNRGASTISQQVAKNLFLWPNPTLFRKAVEAYFTVWLEVLWPKKRILEVYLNVAEFGPGIFGVETASQRAFGKPARDLTLDEAAILAAVLPSPKRMSIEHPSEYVRKRAQEIVTAARLLGGPAYVPSL